MSSFIESTYAEDQRLPKAILVNSQPAAADVLEEWLSGKRGSQVRILVPQRGSKRRLMETVARNAKEAFERHRMKRSSDFASRARALNELQEYLGLQEAPLRIECFDISNLGPTDVVGSMVVFEDALPRKSDYRKFRVGSVEGQDDVSSMGEIIERRFVRFLKEQDRPLEKGSRFAYRPSLVVVDGGKGQLNRAVQVMAGLGVADVPVIALAKRLEEVFVPGRPDPVILPRGSEALYLMQRIRDEAHRFAITYQRSTRAQRMTRSALDQLPGVGPQRRKALLRHFGSTSRVREATREEISVVPGIGPALASKIYERLRSAV
jgi:excinuclease ABC subunit C